MAPMRWRVAVLAGALALPLAACAAPRAPQPQAAATPPAALVGQWNGSWDATFPTTLVVEQVRPGQAQVIYEWGVAPAWNIDIPGQERSIAHYDGRRLVVLLANGAVASYVAQPDGTLRGTYRFGSRIAYATLRQ
ncbi:MAG: hypothetical protein KGK10_05405 [Rhodospirillales bacterium]|nr:hypothetical protein [Rhodospirillales bacterium]